MCTTTGFIILRHVNSKETNMYWQECYDCIRSFYSTNKIIIIDDNSDIKFLTNDKKLYRTTIINSEYPKRGELLPYYYYLQNKQFDVAVIVHDSVFIKKYIDFSVDKYKIIWEFNHGCGQIEDETKIIKALKSDELLSFYKNKKLWKGVFGGMVIIEYNYLQYINNKYDLSILLDYILTRYNRCSFERVIACMLQCNYKKKTLLGNIHKYCKWGLTYLQYKCNTDNNIKNLPIVKVWTGR